MDKLKAMRVFIEVAKCRSFVAASRKLDMTAPTVTRFIAQFENDLGVRLFNRSTRHVRLTDAGAGLYEDSRRILDDVEQAVATASGSYAEPRGILSITAPVLFGQIHVMPIVTEYLDQNPGVSVKAAFFDRTGDLLEEGLDVAVRIGHLKDSSVYATPVGSVRRLLCASPAYLKKHGKPRQPADLSEHQIIQASAVEPSTTWRFESSAGKHSVKVTPRLYLTQNGAAISAAMQGFGITRVMSYQVGEELNNGSLVRVLPDYETRSLPINIVYLEGRHANPKIRSFIDFATTQLRTNPYIEH